MGQSLQIEWRESAAELKAKYQNEKHAQRRIRLLALWHLRQGKPIQEVVESIGTPYRVIQRWVAWYRQGGLEAVMQRVSGHGARGSEAYLTPLQQKALVTRVALGNFRTVWAVVHWAQARWGIRYSYEGMRSLMKRHQLGLKVPRPQSEKTDIQRQVAWKKGV